MEDMEGDIKSERFQKRNAHRSEGLLKHDELRRYLNGQIPQRDLKNLKDSIRTMQLLEPKFLDDHVKDFSDIFLKLCAESIISPGKYAQLIMLFQCNRLIALAEHVLGVQNNFPPLTPPTPNYDLPKPFEETRGKTNIHGQETMKPDPDMGPGSGMDVRGHEEIEYGASGISQHKNLADPDTLDHGGGGTGYYPRGSDTAGLEADTREVVEPHQIIKPVRLVAHQPPNDISRVAEMMQCDSDPQKEGLMSSNFQGEAAYQPPVSQRAITDATDGVSRMQIDPPDTDPTAEPIVPGDETRCGIRPPTYGSMYPNPDGTPQKHQRVVPGHAQVPQPPKVPQPPGQTESITQCGDVSGIGNMGNFYVGGAMTVTSETYTKCPAPPMFHQIKGKRPAGSSRSSEGAPLKKGADVNVVTTKTTQVRGPQGAAKGRTVHQTSNVSGVGNFGNFFCAGDMKMTKSTVNYIKK